MNMNITNTTKDQRNKLSVMAEKFVLDSIRFDHPEWVDKEGDCPKCNEYYESLSELVTIQDVDQ